MEFYARNIKKESNSLWMAYVKYKKTSMHNVFLDVKTLKNTKKSNGPKIWRLAIVQCVEGKTV